MSLASVVLAFFVLLFVSVYALLSRFDEFGKIDKFSVFGVFSWSFASCDTRFSFSLSGGLGDPGGVEDTDDDGVGVFDGGDGTFDVKWDVVFGAVPDFFGAGSNCLGGGGFGSASVAHGTMMGFLDTGLLLQFNGFRVSGSVTQIKFCADNLKFLNC